MTNLNTPKALKGSSPLAKELEPKRLNACDRHLLIHQNGFKGKIDYGF